MRRKEKGSGEKVAGLLGVGLDGDGQRRVTEAEDVLLFGGSAETHERMQDTVIRLQESLQRRGKRLTDASPDELADLLRDAARRGG
jgi:hypothetical protein